MPEPTTTTTTQEPQQVQAAAPSAPAAKTVTMTEDELHALRRQWKEEAVKDRFKNQPDPAEIDRLRKERDQLASEKAQRDDAEKTELQKLVEARDAALAKAADAEAKAQERISQAQATVNAKLVESEVLRAIETLQKKGVIAQSVYSQDIVELTAKGLNVADGKVTGRDQYERPCTVEDYLTAWVAQPNRANYRPPAPAGTGTDPGGVPGEHKEPPKTTSQAWSRVLPGGRGRHKRPTGTQYGEAAQSPPAKV